MRSLGQSLGIPLPPTSPQTREREQEERSSPEQNGQPEDAPVMTDQQGQTQYIGPASSYLLQLKIRTLFGFDQPVQKPSHFLLFGQNPTEKVPVDDVPLFGRERTRSLSKSISIAPELSEASPTDVRSMAPPVEEPSAQMLPPPAVSDASFDVQAISDSLINAYFDYVHDDFLVLHEATFREEYERFCIAPETSSADPTWLCILLCVLILARRVAPSKGIALPQADGMEEKWWRHVQSLLPGVLFTSSVSAVQALILAGLHLHNTSHRDACWTLTAAAVRIAMAIGLHREPNKSLHTPLLRELRKRLWWTLYEFEQLQASSHDRPSAIDDSICTTGCPKETILGMRGDFLQYSNRLAIMLSQASSVIRKTAPSGPQELYRGPLSPAAALLRELTRWQDSLPAQLRLEHFRGKSPSFQRSVLLLHIQYHHIVTVLTRNALLTYAAKVPEGAAADEEAAMSSKDTLTMARVCVDAGKQACELLLKLDSIGRFNAVTWWDMYYLYSSTMVVVLAIICEIRHQEHGGPVDSPMSDSLTDSQTLLQECVDLAAKHFQNPMMPGTMHRWAVVVSEIKSMTDEFLRRSSSSAKEENGEEVNTGTFLDGPLGSLETMTGSAYLYDQQYHPAFRQHQTLSDFHMDNGDGTLMASGNGQLFANANNALPWNEDHWRDIASMLLGGDFSV